MTQADVLDTVRDIIAAWAPLMGLGDWTIRARASALRKKIHAQITALPQYHEALMEINADALLNASVDELEAVVVHELAHCITWPLVNLPIDAHKQLLDYMDEQQTTIIAESLVRARNSGMQRATTSRRRRRAKAA